MPVVVSIFFFIIYHVIYMTGERWLKGELLSFEGMWIANIILLPFGIWLSYKATKILTY